MGTRSLTHFIDTDGGEAVEIACLYRQFDGYPSGHGLELANFLAGTRLVNGIPCGVGVDEATIFNGAGDLAVRVITHLKNLHGAERAGSFYLQAPHVDHYEEYDYVVTCRVGEEPRISCQGYDLPCAGTATEMRLLFAKAEDD